jgi:hypothetical protein
MGINDLSSVTFYITYLYTYQFYHMDLAPLQPVGTSTSTKIPVFRTCSYEIPLLPLLVSDAYEYKRTYPHQRSQTCCMSFSLLSRPYTKSINYFISTIFMLNPFTALVTKRKEGKKKQLLQPHNRGQNPPSRSTGSSHESHADRPAAA